MGAWKDNMPAGMLLKSYPWATNLAVPNSDFTLKKFCVENAILYNDSITPLSIETFISYGEVFQKRFVPFVERKALAALEPNASGLSLRFDDGEIVHARRVVLAVGMSPFKYLPPDAAQLPAEMVSHAGDYGAFDALDGKEVVIVGSGSSATDLSALLHESGISVSILARADNLTFASPPRPRGLAQRIIGPTSGIGNGWTMEVCADAPWLVRFLPKDLRVRLANARALGPLGGAFMRDRVVGKFPIRLGRTIAEMAARYGRAHLRTTTADGREETLRADHVIFATGYRTDLDRLPFLAPEVAARMRRTGAAPALSGHYESSVPGLHFIGPSSANSFGPVCRFVYGTGHPAQHLARYLPAVLGGEEVPIVTGQTDTAVLQ